ncbi:MAG: metalloregulator ArsR/SmtB family transcription factor [Fimbriimonadales bacterium]|nr:metalloregulator ArsR/SmtB family transcription factor [Fimbriimonadales bacterium]
MNGLSERKAMQIARALADPTRLSILRALLQQSELSCGELAERFPVAQSTVSHHLNILINADLAAMRKQGQHHYFRARRETLCAFARWLATLEQTECDALNSNEEVEHA